MQAEGRISELCGRCAGYADVNRHGLHVQTVLRDAMTVRTEPLVAPRSSVATHNVDFCVRTTERRRQVVEQIEDARIVLMHVAGPVIAKKMVQLGKSSGIIAVAVPVNDVEMLASVGMEEMKAIGIGRQIGISCERARRNEEEKTREESEE